MNIVIHDFFFFVHTGVLYTCPILTASPAGRSQMLSSANGISTCLYHSMSLSSIGSWTVTTSSMVLPFTSNFSIGTHMSLFHDFYHVRQFLPFYPPFLT